MITQCRFSENVKHFESGFAQRWGLSGYEDINAPCFFAGVYTDEDVKAINDHRGFVVVWNTSHERPCFNQIRTDIIVMEGVGVPFSNLRYKKKKVTIQIKDFSMFEPCPLGSKIYCYIRNLGDGAKRFFNFDMVEKASQLSGFEVIYGIRGHAMDYVKREFYDNCFLGINLNKFAGLTTATELAYMGRKTISLAQTPFCIAYKSVEDIAQIIINESKKIGTIQDPVIGDFFTADKEWKNIEFWI